MGLFEDTSYLVTLAVTIAVTLGSLAWYVRTR